MTEINPEHPVTKEMREQWQKIVALIMHKLQIKEIRITSEDIKRMGDDKAVVVEAHNDTLTVMFMTLKAAEAYASLKEKEKA